MFNLFLSLLRNIKLVLIRILTVLYGFIPDAMKRRFTELSSRGAFVGMFLFVLDIFKNIYFIIAIPALIVAYRLLKVLKEKGIIDDFEAIVNNTVNSILNISTNCFPMILDLKSMLACITQS
jgi:hypothetical protein